MTQARHLDVTTLPLRGRHLIEASAGTGKTFNITRLYLRLLLEKHLSVQEILVMTFTKAATEEIRGRLAETLQSAIVYWEAALAGEADAQAADPVYDSLYQRLEPHEALACLKAAQLEMDEAAVFTIHGFCQHVLGLLSFESGTAMQLTLVTDASELYEQAAQDWIRRIAVSDPDGYLRLAGYGWHNPDTLLDEFGAAIRQNLVPQVVTEQQVQQDAQEHYKTLANSLKATFTSVYQGLCDSSADIIATLVDDKKDEAVRREEWDVLMAWVMQAEPVIPPPEIKRFINGNRYRGNDTIKAIFAPLKALINSVTDSVKDIESLEQEGVSDAPVFALIADAFRFIREHVTTHKLRDNLIEFDDLISRLAESTRSPSSPLAESLRMRFPAALIDEFQDTDANQYAIADAVYPRGSDDQVLMMIGDPKQAIYGFRGGDIFTYLKAGQEADYRWFMDTNWRSVKPMVDAYNRLFYGAGLDEQAGDVFGFGIRYLPVRATEKAKATATPLTDPTSSRAALTYIAFDDEEARTKSQQQSEISRWIGQEIHRLLSEARLGERAVAPSDIAILVRSSSEASVIRDALSDVGLAAVFLSDKQSLFNAAQTKDLYRVLDAIWHLNVHSRVTACLSSPLLGFSHQQVINLLHHDDDALWDTLLELLGMLRMMWQQRGCMSVILYLLQHHYQPQARSPERDVTNYLHLAEVLEREATQHARADQLLLWLHRQMTRPQNLDETVQRLESDQKLIQIVTQHGSKGLEYPIVFVPFANAYRDPSRQGNRTARQFQFYDEEAQSLVLQLGKTQRAISRVKAEGEAEAVRLLYVAVTRAAHRCYLGIAPFDKTEESALAQAAGVRGETFPVLCDALRSVSEHRDGHTCLLLSEDHQAPVAGRISPHTVPALSAAEFTGCVDDRWRLYSFSALARQQTHSRQTVRDQEFQSATLVADTPVPLSQSAFRYSFEKGARAGNLLHDLLEHKDFSHREWTDDSRQMAKRFGLDEAGSEALFAWLDEVLATPLDGDAVLTMASLDLPATLREAEFYFPMDNLDMSALSAQLQRHRDNLSSLTAPLPVTLPGRHQLEGMMHGFIDLIFEHNGRYYVCDYKSTWLGNQADDYAPAALCLNNQHHLYDLQYLIYSLALHRYLRTSMPDYDPQLHFGGVYYLYLRGMHPDHAPGQGVFYTALSPDELTALDSLFGQAEEAAL
ncbi:exodeoxyribonuclease V subunit beta [Alteromonas sp. CYL-A6]|uniref:exodeoxyribonuclease V subunit beta n=1 Tax=Alteromonas nitratireducens TaxID=3390813 RepID=UPI0034BCC803